MLRVPPQLDFQPVPITRCLRLPDVVNNSGKIFRSDPDGKVLHVHRMSTVRR